jgi:hypothetical protein
VKHIALLKFLHAEMVTEELSDEEIPVRENENETRNMKAAQPPRGRIVPHIPAH